MTTNRRKIGHIITEGGTIREIQKEIPGFPSNPTVEYFEFLGYATSTAKKYVSQLQKNKAIKLEKLANEGFTFSENADLSNLIVDTCAVQHPACLNLIEDASHVTILYQTIVEMDTVRFKYGKKNKHTDLCESILNFSRYILSNPSKFQIAPFNTNTKEYVDDSVIEFLKDLPLELRPTLISADTNLCLKAKCFQIEYIYYTQPKVQIPKQTSKSPSKQASNSSSIQDIESASKQNFESASSYVSNSTSKQEKNQANYQTNSTSKPKKISKNLIDLGHGLKFKKCNKKYYIVSDGSFSYCINQGKEKYTYLLGLPTENRLYSNDSISVSDNGKEYLYQVKHLIKKLE